ncbi:hypothetical protein [Marinomonas algicola]|uniref:hypothetical protein n=1 Tax=Marinomonas algicola TaxID=2773454 RepID=UPI0017484333|nr:hypothetical protein [Marinomonas algicola]
MGKTLYIRLCHPAEDHLIPLMVALGAQKMQKQAAFIMRKIYLVVGRLQVFALINLF